ncbi:hypothetical protein HAX54_052217 [Datura stramonium]|uniref:NB-ARC domain-containing protein n=1 Tax=Datura stramonium TaxID=4076 RepID=A0ABS8SYM2_DATST|nr:hypothetical protein [Datura stramonium]
MLSELKEDIVQGFDDGFEIIVKRLTGQPSDLDIVTITGIGGIGKKTALAKKAYDHLPIRYHFDIHVWVTISQQFQRRNVLLDACHCISKQTVIDKAKDYDEMGRVKLADLVQKNLKECRDTLFILLMIFGDADVWDK